LIIDAASEDTRVRAIAIYTHIVDKKTGKDYNDHHIRWFDTKTKRCEYILHKSNGDPLVYLVGKDDDHFETVRCKLRNARAVVLVPKKDARLYLEWAFELDPEGVLNRDIDIVVDGPDALKIHIDNLPNEKPLEWLTVENYRKFHDV
jgi:hypothetical protein